MQYRVLGKTGLKISRMGFGGIPIQKIDAHRGRSMIQKMAMWQPEWEGSLRENGYM